VDVSNSPVSRALKTVLVPVVVVCTVALAG